jgi:hypothetical protein
MYQIPKTAQGALRDLQKQEFQEEEVDKWLSSSTHLQSRQV